MNMNLYTNKFAYLLMYNMYIHLHRHFTTNKTSNLNFEICFFHFVVRKRETKTVTVNDCLVQFRATWWKKPKTSRDMLHIQRLSDCNSYLCMTSWRWCDPWTACPVRPTYAFLWRSRPDRQTAAALLTRPAPHTQHATCCRGSWTTLTKVILYIRIHMYNTLYFAHTAIHTHPGHSCRSDAHESITSALSNSLYWM